jgi:hypothetical protein
MMTTRRNCLAGLTTLAVAGGVARASTLGQVLKIGPKPKLIKGNPDKVDFGHGLLVPMNGEAFHTLWEGDDRWISYGHGFGRRAVAAMAMAEEAAIGTMKLYLITLAFAPDKLVRIDGGGWRLKTGNVADLLKGEIDLPGRPVMPTTDRMTGDQDGDVDNSATGEEQTHATTGYLVWKKDVTLDTVRANAILAQH